MGYSNKETPCVVCGKTPTDLDHIKTRGAGGKDDDFNLMPLCRAHHTEKGQYGINRMAQTYPNYRRWLIKHGWKLDPVFIKWRHK